MRYDDYNKYLTWFIDQCYYAKVDRLAGANNSAAAWTHLIKGGYEDHLALEDTIFAVNSALAAIAHILTGGLSTDGITYLSYTLLYSVNYRTICDGWAADSFRGRAETIAYIDRMRQLIWDEPFNAIWAARPEGG